MDPKSVFPGAPSYRVFRPSAARAKRGWVQAKKYERVGRPSTRHPHGIWKRTASYVFLVMALLVVACGGISNRQHKAPPEPTAGAGGEAGELACVPVDVDPATVCPRPPCVPVEGSPGWCVPVPQAVYTCTAPPDTATCNPATRSGRATAWCCWDAH